MFAVTMETFGDRLKMWSNKRDRFDELVNKMVEALSNRESDPLLIQHLGDCVRRQDKIEASLKRQDEIMVANHRENSQKLQWLIGLVLAAVLALAGTLAMQLVNSYKVEPSPPMMMHNHK